VTGAWLPRPALERGRRQCHPGRVQEAPQPSSPHPSSLRRHTPPHPAAPFPQARDPPATAQAPALPSSVAFPRLLLRQALPAGGWSWGWDPSGSRRLALRPAPSAPPPPPSPLSQAFLDKLAQTLGRLRGRGRRREREGNRAERRRVERILEPSAFHPSFGPRARIQGSKLISFHVSLSLGDRRRRTSWSQTPWFHTHTHTHTPHTHTPHTGLQASQENRDSATPSFGGKG
jgi:hypothetical protein